MEKPYGMDGQIEERPRIHFCETQRRSDIGRNDENLDALEHHISTRRSLEENHNLVMRPLYLISGFFLSFEAGSVVPVLSRVSLGSLSSVTLQQKKDQDMLQLTLGQSDLLLDHQQDKRLFSTEKEMRGFIGAIHEPLHIEINLNFRAYTQAYKPKSRRALKKPNPGKNTRRGVQLRESRL